jgi:hypothetical protein
MYKVSHYLMIKLLAICSKIWPINNSRFNAAVDLNANVV